ncbi:hypothetical protein CPB83DRAFT_852369 [Crepidotus variabilis]|uniref:Uncharacterized protein n=1 Tax=Crepidotus variabilis TaxID=179855 RepID=A0A9P6JQU5_9AGAR|nr:hypothetical protein CPB83DRAFT_852369 [Crepidotus variabilis]
MAQAQPTIKPTLWVVVDDTSPEISYLGPSGSWFGQDGVSSFFTRNDSSAIINSNGLVYNGTQHGSRLPASFSLSYSGVGFEAIGTIEHGNRSKGDLQWHCFVDGNEVQNNTSIQTLPADNNWFICGDWQTGGSGERQHTLTVNISATKELPFWFDWMRYTPSSDLSLENKMVRLEKDDPSVLAGLSSGWDVGMGTTTTKGASFRFEFIGTSFGWYGLAQLDNIDPPTVEATIGSYSVDGGPNQPVNFPNVPSRGHWFNQKFFETGILPMAKHKISVIYTDTGKYPLGLTFLRMQNGSLSDLVATPEPPAHSPRQNIVILSTVIPIAVIAIAILLGWFENRRRRNRHSREVPQISGPGDGEPQDLTTPVPFFSPASPLGFTDKSTFVNRSDPSAVLASQRDNILVPAVERKNANNEPEVVRVGLSDRRTTYTSEAPPSYTA